MRMRTIVQLTVIFVSLLAVSGCSPKFACSDDIYSGEPRCSSVSAMYNTKMRGVEDNTGAKKKEKDTEDAPVQKQLVPKPASKPDQGVEVLKNMNYSAKVPMRISPKIIRIWIAPWEDSDGDLHQPGYVFSEINDKRGRWLFGEKETTGSQPMLKPIERVQNDPDDQKKGAEKPDTAIKPRTADKEPTLKLK